MVLKAITFDFWNTLASDREPVRVREIAAEKMVTHIRGEGTKISSKNMQEAFAECRKLCYSYQEDKGIDLTPKEQLDWILEYFDLKPKPMIWNKLFDDYTTSLLDIPPRFVDELGSILKELGSKYKMAIICNTGRTPGWVIRSIVRECSLDGFFDAQIFSNEVGVAKPNPYIFEIAARMLNVQNNETLHIGDDIHTDVGGALGAGYRTGWYNPKGLCREVKCHYVFKDFSDILKLL